MLAGVLLVLVLATGLMLDAAMRQLLWQAGMLLVVATGICGWLLMRYRVLRPIDQLRQALHQAGAGDRLFRMPETRSDEIGAAGRAFNRMQQRMGATEEHLRGIFDHITDAIIEVDGNGVIETANPAAYRLFGYAADELRGGRLPDLVPVPRRAGAEGAVDGALPEYLTRGFGATHELNGRHKSGAMFPVEITVSRMVEDGRLHLVGIVRDVTGRREQLAALRHQALHDALTGLPNRMLLLDRLEQAILAARRGEQTLALMITDLDHFKEINDTLGHPFGDLILQETASRMKAAIRNSDTVARLGGDEFAFVLPAADCPHARQIAEKVLREVERPFELEGNNFIIGASVGIAMFPEHGADTSTLMRHADVAMYVAKREHSGYAVYNSDQDQHSRKYLALKAELHAALESDQLRLCYQPVIDLQTGRVTGLEALARWHHPTRGVLYPDEFIPLAERTGQIRALTQWVLKTAVQHSLAWYALGLELRIAINLSVHNLHDNGLPETVTRLIGGKGARAIPLRLEITESAVMPGPARALEVLNRLSAQGIRISIDDFGTGYSSLAYLKRLPVDEIKIDKSFVAGMTLDNDDAVIVRSTIDLAHNIGLRVVAEGVEDKATFDLLAGMRCDAVQGYYVSRPLGADALVDWLQASSWRPASASN